ncbi:GNAT family N-acetyltransferase [Streptomyces sp. NPDC050585]|uniref:GNAT family N-acetyltransferase n=1 Tax=Streptomyces sp. NPDC050585 TaxID=3365632 RepID=UPI003787264A
MRWWDIAPVLELERELFPDDAWSEGMFWSELAHARGPRSTRRYIVAEELPGDGPDERPDVLPQDGPDVLPRTRAEARPQTGPALPGARPHQRSGERGPADAGRPARIVGYAGLAAAGGLGDVQTIAVARDQWGTGLGARLLTELLHHATAFECEEVLLEVRVDNTRAQRLYERFGFEPIGFRRGYYQPGNVDALVMRLTVQDPASPGPEPETTDDPTHPTDLTTPESAETHG